MTSMIELRMNKSGFFHFFISVLNCLYHLWMALEINNSWVIGSYYFFFGVYIYIFCVIIDTKDEKTRKLIESYMHLIGVIGNLWMYFNLLWSRVTMQNIDEY